MLARVILALAPAPLRARIRGELAKDPDLVLETISESTGLWDRLRKATADLIVVSESLVPAPGPETIGLFRELPEAPGVVLLSASEDAESHATFLAAGCDTVLYSGLASRRLRAVIEAVLAKRTQAAPEELAIPRSLEEPRLADFVSRSPAMRAFMQVVRRVADRDSSLLILGETGVGKERLARAIHGEGPRSVGPFVAVNCAALPESLLESELFGHEQGAFTGATRSRRGCFELAHGGTVFLDEIAEVPTYLQVKLLRVLQEREIQRVGAEKVTSVNVRVMAATNRPIEAQLASGAFRQDLYYRLGVVSLTIPPLRERREDIPELVDSYINFLRPRIGCDVYGIDNQARAALEGYPWPGNVRELINVIERAMLLAASAEITLADLPSGIRGCSPAAGGSETGKGGQRPLAVPDAWLDEPLKAVRKRVVADVETAYLARLLERTRGRVGETAALAGLEPRSLYAKMKRYGLRKEDFRSGPV